MKNILIVIDMQNGFLENKYTKNLISQIEELLNTFLQRLCQLNDGQLPRKVYLAGVDTDCCVLTTATSLFENNIRPIVLTKYCASNGGPQSHEAGILCLKRLIGEKQLFHKTITSRQDLV